MSLNRENVQYILARFGAGIPPRQILNELQYRAYLPWITIGTVERCIRENGRRQEISAPPANQGGPGPSTATQSARQFSASPAMRTLETDDLVDPGPTMPWDSQADKFAISAYRGGKSEDYIWVTLRSHGYDITRPEVVASLIKQGISAALWTQRSWNWSLVSSFHGVIVSCTAVFPPWIFWS